MAVPNPKAKHPCPFAFEGKRHDCQHLLVLEQDVYDANNIRHFAYDYDCTCPNGVCTEQVDNYSSRVRRSEQEVNNQ